MPNGYFLNTHRVKVSRTENMMVLDMTIKSKVILFHFSLIFLSHFSQEKDEWPAIVIN